MQLALIMSGVIMAGLLVLVVVLLRRSGQLRERAAEHAERAEKSEQVARNMEALAKISYRYGEIGRLTDAELTNELQNSFDDMEK